MDIKDKIFTIRKTQVMLDRDLAELYDVETRALNQAVKRNSERFPKDFMFQLTNEELNYLRSQIVTLSNSNLVLQNKTSNVSSSRSHFVILKKGRGKNVKYMPHAFTEQGVAMLSGVLKSERAIEVNVQIMRAFISMRKFISKNAEIFLRLDNAEHKLLEHDQKFDKVFNAIEEKQVIKKQGIFFNGQVFDAHKFILDLIGMAKKKIVLIDNYIDHTVLNLFCDSDIDVVIYTGNISSRLKLSLEKYNSQYKPIIVKEFSDSHDRFLIVDDKEVYHFGASLKDLGRKWFAFSKFDIKALDILTKLN